MPHTAYWEGPNIYMRCIRALQSGIKEEVSFALHHLVKVSHERGDKYKFDAFPGLAEVLLEKVLEVGSLFYEIEWTVIYENEDFNLSGGQLNGLYGTPDILSRIKSLKQRNSSDSVQSEDFVHSLERINEAGLVVRNMAILEDNARFLSTKPVLKDMLCIILNLPARPFLVELRHNALEIAEQVTKYWTLAPDDPLYQSLLSLITSSDRGASLSAIRASSRISMNRDEHNRLLGVPAATMQQICWNLLLEDEELVQACLDFLYQSTSVDTNVESILTGVDVSGLFSQLARLLSAGAVTYEDKVLISPIPQPVEPPPRKVLPTPKDLLEQVLRLNDPSRTTEWLRSCFEEASDDHMTQLELWQAYQNAFATQQASTGIMAAADFIKTVSATFNGASAQVVNERGGNPKFIIRGIRPRLVPRTIEGKDYIVCLWKYETGAECGEYQPTDGKMWEHLLRKHNSVPFQEDGKVGRGRAASKQYNCRWGDCTHFQRFGLTDDPYELNLHVRIHLNNPKVERKEPEPVYKVLKWTTTAVDERGDAAGVPLSASLVLRNLARNFPRADDDEEELLNRLFGPVLGKIWDVYIHSRQLPSYMDDILHILDKRMDVMTTLTN